MSIKNLVEMIKHNGLLTSMAQLEKLYKIDIENEEKLAESEARCAALAAELSAVEEIHNEAVFITDEHYEQCPPEVRKVIKSLAVMQIPAYQAFLAEVRAQGVEMYADNIDAGADDAECSGFDDAVKFLRSEALAVREFAAQLRKGAAS
ncbi:hypothetical protein [Enterobacter hormaechei]|uniref:hypothetical protein n=1 Tax=Enterobacter hormaechei TaxID=158836 RepID=UPI003F652AFE